LYLPSDFDRIVPGYIFLEYILIEGGCYLPKMYDTDVLEDTVDVLKIKNIIRIEGPLPWAWGKIVAVCGRGSSNIIGSSC